MKLDKIYFIRYNNRIITKNFQFCEVYLKIYDLIENIKIWTEIYRESSEEDKETDAWKKNMLKVLSKLNVAEELELTPFKQKLEDIINLAKKNEFNQITNIYEELKNIEKYFQENYDTFN